MIYKSLNKDWYYSYLDIPNLDVIKLEILNFYTKSLSAGNAESRHAGYHNIFRKDITDCPMLFSYLESLGLLGKLNRFLIATGLQTSSNPHIDAGNPFACTYSLNIPIQATDNSHTVWYDTSKKVLLDGSKSGKNPEMSTNWCNITDATEIIRVRCDRPMLVNTTILHRGDYQNADRTMCCIRFYPELLSKEIRGLGIAVPLKQTL